MEPIEPLRFGVTNLTGQPLTGAKASLVLRGGGGQTVALPEIASGQQHVMEYRFDTALRPDTYTLSARSSCRATSRFLSAIRFPWFSSRAGGSCDAGRDVGRREWAARRVA
jgi:hypothetical protein